MIRIEGENRLESGLGDLAAVAATLARAFDP